MSEALFTPDATWLAGGHRRKGGLGGTDVWLTPPHVLRALGEFDLDPCAAPEPRPWATANEHVAPPEDGLRSPWRGRCWVNPPYTDIAPWLSKLADHGDGIALTFARTETAAFHDYGWQRASAMLFLRGRLTFHRADGRAGRGNAGASSVLIGYGSDNAYALERAASLATLPGCVVHLR